MFSRRQATSDPVWSLIAKHIVDVRDYEAGRKAFWTEFRPGYYLDENYLRPESLRNLQTAIAAFEKRTGQRVDYISFTNMPAAKAPAPQELGMPV